MKINKDQAESALKSYLRALDRNEMDYEGNWVLRLKSVECVTIENALKYVIEDKP